MNAFLEYRTKVIDRIFKVQGANGFWKMLTPKDKYFPDYMHYVPNFRGSLWVLLQLADLKLEPSDKRIKKALQGLKDQFWHAEYQIYALKEDHFPIPCLNGNMLYLDCYFNGSPDERSLKVIDFFHRNQRFDDGCYIEPKNEFCKNKSCYGPHSCYWGIVKLFKGLTFIPITSRSKQINALIYRCIDFILLHKVCFSSHKEGKIMIQKIDQLTFPNMYKSDFLEILWLLKRENVVNEKLKAALEILISKRQEDGSWKLERKLNNLISSIGEKDKPNPFITERANEVLSYYQSFFSDLSVET